jgi:hypothetical protein
LATSHMMQELSTEAETKDEPSTDQHKSDTSLVWFLAEWTLACEWTYICRLRSNPFKSGTRPGKVDYFTKAGIHDLESRNIEEMWKTTSSGISEGDSLQDRHHFPDGSPCCRDHCFPKHKFTPCKVHHTWFRRICLNRLEVNTQSEKC